MSPLASLSAGALIALVAFGLLALIVQRLGKSAGLWGAVQVLGLLTLKFALLVLGFRWLVVQPWLKPIYTAAGVALPLIILVLWKGRLFANQENHG